MRQEGGSIHKCSCGNGSEKGVRWMSRRFRNGNHFKKERGQLPVLFTTTSSTATTATRSGRVAIESVIIKTEKSLLFGTKENILSVKNTSHVATGLERWQAFFMFAVRHTEPFGCLWPGHLLSQSYGQIDCHRIGRHQHLCTGDKWCSNRRTVASSSSRRSESVFSVT